MYVALKLATTTEVESAEYKNFELALLELIAINSKLNLFLNVVICLFRIGYTKSTCM